MRSTNLVALSMWQLHTMPGQEERWRGRHHFPLRLTNGLRPFHLKRTADTFKALLETGCSISVSMMKKATSGRRLALALSLPRHLGMTHLQHRIQTFVSVALVATNMKNNIG